MPLHLAVIALQQGLKPVPDTAFPINQRAIAIKGQCRFIGPVLHHLHPACQRPSKVFILPLISWCFSPFGKPEIHGHQP